MPANSGGAVPGIGGLAGLAMGAAGMRRKREVVDTHQPAARRAEVVAAEREVVDTHQPAASGWKLWTPTNLLRDLNR